MLQYSPACAAGAAIVTSTSVDNPAAEAVIIFEIGFTLLSFGKLSWQPGFPTGKSGTPKPGFNIQKMHSLHRDMRDLNDAREMDAA